MEETSLRILLTRRVYRAACFKARLSTSVKFSKILAAISDEHAVDFRCLYTV